MCSAYSVVPKNPVVLETWYWKRGVSRFLPVSLVQCDEPNRLEYPDCSTYNGLAFWSEEAHVGR